MDQNRLSRHGIKPGDRAQDFAPITKNHTDVFEVLISQIRKDGKINPVFSKALRVLGHAEFFEPLRYLLHRGSVPTMIGACPQAANLIRVLSGAVGQAALARYF